MLRRTLLAIAVLTCGASGAFGIEPKPCSSETAECAVHGLCKATAAGTCEPTPAGCRKSFACKALGACTLTRVGPTNNNLLSADGCRAKDDSECARAPGCKYLGRCAISGFGAGDMACVATDNAHCRGSLACTRGGRCATSEDETCVAEDESDCETSLACKELGMCVTGEADQGCFAAGDHDCQRAAICKQHGACHFDRMRHRCTVDPTPGACGMVPVGVPVARVGVSSTHPKWKEYTFDGANLADGDATTSWQPETKKTGGVGERVTLHLVKPARVSQVRITNGFQRHDRLGDLFLWNNRIRHAVVSAGGTKEVITFEHDAREPGTVSLTPTMTDRVTIEIGSVHQGLLWNDLAISEIEVLACRGAGP